MQPLSNKHNFKQNAKRLGTSFYKLRPCCMSIIHLPVSSAPVYVSNVCTRLVSICSCWRNICVRVFHRYTGELWGLLMVSARLLPKTSSFKDCTSIKTDDIPPWVGIRWNSANVPPSPRRYITELRIKKSMKKKAMKIFLVSNFFYHSLLWHSI